MLQKIRNHHIIKSYFNEYANKHELVYFGDLRESDEVFTYRGATFSPDSKDTHYTHGTVNGYDVSAFQRASRHTLHDRQSTANDWTIVAIHLKQGGFPHLVIDAKKHDKVFYQAFFLKFPRLRRAGALLDRVNPSSGNSFDLYLAPESSQAALSVLDDVTLQHMLLSYSKYDVELDDDKLYVFSRGAPSSARQLNDMLAEGLWLSEKFELKNAYSDNLSLAGA